MSEVDEAAEVAAVVEMSDEHLLQMRAIRSKVLEASRQPLPEGDPDFAELARGSLIFAFNRLAGDDGLTAHVRTAPASPPHPQPPACGANEEKLK